MNQFRFNCQSRLRLVSRVVAPLLMLAILGGCQKMLFNPDDPRTQFEVHDRMRQRYIPLEEQDVFGQPQPALRARLSPDS
ncbi:MAG: hypothetical protein QMB94_06705 [Phycisphaerales bacterium]